MPETVEVAVLRKNFMARVHGVVGEGDAMAGNAKPVRKM